VNVLCSFTSDLYIGNGRFVITSIIELKKSCCSHSDRLGSETFSVFFEALHICLQYRNR
jgi:hypothetical protein